MRSLMVYILPDGLLPLVSVTVLFLWASHYSRNLVFVYISKWEINK